MSKSTLVNESTTQSTAFFTVTVTTTVTSNIGYVANSVLSRTETTCPPATTVVQSSSSAGLGVFTALLVIALVTVTGGWVWTYWTMKKKERAKIRINMAQMRISIAQLRDYARTFRLRLRRNSAYEGQTPNQDEQLNLECNPAYIKKASNAQAELELTYEVITYQNEDNENSDIKVHDYELPDEQEQISSQPKIKEAAPPENSRKLCIIEKVAN